MFKELVLAHQRGDAVHTTVAPPSTGKSCASLMEAAWLLTKGVRLDDGVHRLCRGVIIVTPFTDIVKNYLQVPAVEVPSGPNGRSHRKPFTVDLGRLWGQSVDLKAGKGLRPATRAETEAFFAAGGGGILVLTHKALQTRWHLFPKKLSSYHLCVDEAHHAPLTRAMRVTTLTGELRDKFVKRGGTVSQWSATPWHTESEISIIGDDDDPCLISVREAQDAGIVPPNMEFRRRTLAFTANSIRELVMDQCPPKQLAPAYSQAIDQWEETDRPYFLAKVADRHQADACVRAFEDAGARVLLVAGDDYDRDALRHEQDVKRYEDREYDGIVACRRFDEGVDVPSISNVYYFGAPTSSRLVIQVWGRSWRRKDIVGYPRRWRKRSALTIFIPDGSHTLDEYLRVHGRQAVILATYLADITVGQRVLNLRDRLREGLGGPYHEETDEDGERRIAQRKRLNQIFGSEISMAEAAETFNEIIVRTARKRGEQPDQVGALAVLAEIKSIPDEKLRLRIMTVCQRRWEKMSGKAAQQAAKAVGDVIAREVEEARLDDSLDDQVHAALQEMEHAVDTVAAAMDDMHEAFFLSADERMWEIISDLTSTRVDEIRASMRRLRAPNPERHEIHAVFRAYDKRHGTYPRRDSGPTDSYGLEGFTFAQIARQWPELGLGCDSLEEYGRFYLEGTPRKPRRRR